jgi:NAD(P)-dependent dehydrogenase (short-subunit alcohol dehydrogenase family)
MRPQQGPFLASKHLYASLSTSPWGGRIVNITSDFASIADNNGGNLPYRLSKTSLNQLTATIAAEGSRPSLFQAEYTPTNTAAARELTAISVHPGFLPTAMTGFQGRDDLGASVEGIVGMVERLCAGGGSGGGGNLKRKGRKAVERELEGGGYYRWDGERMAF